MILFSETRDESPLFRRSFRLLEFSDDMGIGFQVGRKNVPVRRTLSRVFREFYRK